MGAAVIARLKDEEVLNFGEAETKPREIAQTIALLDEGAVLAEPEQTHHNNERAAGREGAPCLVAHACTFV